jgi:hypothetical protein
MGNAAALSAGLDEFVAELHAQPASAEASSSRVIHRRVMKAIPPAGAMRQLSYLGW